MKDRILALEKRLKDIRDLLKTIEKDENEKGNTLHNLGDGYTIHHENFHPESPVLGEPGKPGIDSGDEWHVRHNGNKIGSFFVNHDSTRPGVSVGLVRIQGEHRGKGLGKKMYQAMADHYGKLMSDKEGKITPDAMRVWSALDGKSVPNNEGDFEYDPKKFELKGHYEISGKQPTSEIFKTSSNGQWAIDKSDYGPKKIGEEKVDLYDPKVNTQRKMTRTGERIEGIGQNKGVREYTSTPHGTANEQAATEAKKYSKINRKQPVKQYTPEEIKELEAKKKLSGELNKTDSHWAQQWKLQGDETCILSAFPSTKPEKRPDWVGSTGSAITKTNFNSLSSSIIQGFNAPGVRQATNEELFGAGVVTQERADELQKAHDSLMSDFFRDVQKPIQSVKDDPNDFGKGTSYNSLLSVEELQKRNMFIGKDEE